MAKEEKEKTPPTFHEENGRIVIDSPLPEHPGVIVVKKHLDPLTIIYLMKRAGEVPEIYEGEHVPFVLREFYIRFPIFDFQLEGFSIQEKDVAEGTGFPSKLAARCVKATAGIFDTAFDLKN